MHRPSPALMMAGVVSFVVAVVMLGPALGPGLVLSYDLVWSPSLNVSSVALGTGTPAPRAVPSDAVALAVGWVLGPEVAQKVLLLGILLLAGVGTAALLLSWNPHASRLATVGTVTLSLWNPYVAERLVVGHWTVLLGYSVLPWLARAALRSSRGDVLGPADGTGPTGGITPVLPMLGWLAVASLGGANSWILVAPAALLMGLLARRSARSLGWLALVAVGTAGVWALPSVANRAIGDPGGFVAFAARADSPLGLLPSIVGGGGIWNTAVHPAERSVPVLAAIYGVVFAAGMWAAATGRAAPGRRPVVITALLGLGAVAFTAAEVTQPAWVAMAGIPGMSLLRDSHKFVAMWVVVACVGVGLAVDRLVKRRRWTWPLAAVMALAGPVSMPSVAWGSNHRLAAVAVPDDYRHLEQVYSDKVGEEDVGLLPWGQYRRYAWNDDRVSLSLVPRIMSQRVLYDDSLPLRAGRIAGEDRQAAAVTAGIQRGMDPWEAVHAAGVRFVILERRAGYQTGGPKPRRAATIWSSPHAEIVDLAPGADGGVTPSSAVVRAGWAMSGGTVICVGLGALTRRRRPPEDLATAW